MEDKKQDIIDLREIAKNIWNRKMLFVKVWVITFIVACFIIFPVPRTYNAEVSVAPESSSADGGSLSSIASSFGFNIGDMATEDAFYPDIYPDVMASNDFIYGLTSIKIKTLDGTVETDYLDYLKKHNKQTFYVVPFKNAMRAIKGMFKKQKSNNKGSNGHLNLRMLSEEETALFEYIRNAVTCNVDKKTGIITIKTVDQDPLVCVTLADSAMAHLQDFITLYRTNKARVDLEHYTKLQQDAKLAYEKASDEYGKFCDSHTNTILEAVNSKRDQLENEMSMKLNEYNTMTVQVTSAEAKLRERTPAFSLFQSPTVPVKATSPKRMVFVIAMLFLATIGTCVYLAKGFIIEQITHVKK